MGLQRNSSLEDELDTIEIDDLTYEYRENTNQLIKLTDDSTPTNNGGFVDGANLAIEYEYDDFGNMTKDHNKGITEIVYNHLNLPTKITFANSGQIVYVYNALGIKTEKIVTQGSTETITKYMTGGYQYENNVLKFFPHAEGYVIKEGTSTYKHVFNYTDHLGNIRLKYCDLNLNGTIESNEILEENHYYPFGMKHERYNEDSSVLANKYKYNGKEWQDELGLNFYDYHARNYDPAIGRWMNIDPLAENSRRWTPYNYAYNNPIYFIDPDGMQAGAAKGLNYNWKTGRLSYGTDIDNAGYEDDGTFSKEEPENISLSFEGDSSGGEDNGDPKKKNSKLVFKKREGKNAEILSKVDPKENPVVTESFEVSLFEENTIKWFSHGSSEGIAGQMTPEEFSKFLAKNSALFSSAIKNNTPLTLKIYACLTGRYGGLAEQLSIMHPNLKIIAPNNRIIWEDNKQPYIGDAPGIPGGQLIYYQNGSVIGTGNFKQ